MFKYLITYFRTVKISQRKTLCKYIYFYNFFKHTPLIRFLFNFLKDWKIIVDRNWLFLFFSYTLMLCFEKYYINRRVLSLLRGRWPISHQTRFGLKQKLHHCVIRRPRLYTRDGVSVTTTQRRQNGQHLPCLRLSTYAYACTVRVCAYVPSIRRRLIVTR